jgi:3-phosphoshikimate 1-carboxyvinyltransferase
MDEQDAQASDSSTSKTIVLKTHGLSALNQPASPLFAGNSGTTIRLLSGLLAGRDFAAILDGDESLRKRPMNRVIEPLEQMGARIEFLKAPQAHVENLVGADRIHPRGHATWPYETSPTKGFAPFRVNGGKLTGRSFDLKIASAQVETALLLAGLQAEGTTTVTLPAPVRDHTRRMFQYLGVPTLYQDERTISVERLLKPPAAKEIQVPADMSSAAFFMVGACLIKDSEIVLKDVGMNPGRLLVLEVLLSMGAAISIENPREFGFEPVADLKVTFTNRLKGTSVGSAEIARGIDEIPILALAGALCKGEFAVHGAEELRHKESDRLEAITENLKAAGAGIKAKQDGFIIEGKDSLPGGSLWKTYGDHRLAMTGLIASLLCEHQLKVEETDSIKISYPSFEVDLAHLHR